MSVEQKVERTQKPQRSRKTQPHIPFTLEVCRLVKIIKDMDMVVCKGDRYCVKRYHVRYINEVLEDEKIIPWELAIKEREVVREVLSIATDLLFDGYIE